MNLNWLCRNMYFQARRKEENRCRRNNALSGAKVNIHFRATARPAHHCKWNQNVRKKPILHRQGIVALEFASPPDVSVLVVNYNTQHSIDRMMTSLRAGAGNLRLQIIVVDNNSRDGSVALLSASYPEAEVVRSEVNLGFGRANNLALTKARGRYILLLNTDAFVGADALGQTVSFMDQHPKCGVLGTKLVGEDGSLQPYCRYFPLPWNVFVLRIGLQRAFPYTRMIDHMGWDHTAVGACDWVPTCYYLVRREVTDQVGLFDPRFFMYCEEAEHCRRLRQAGWDVIFYRYATVINLGGESAKADGKRVDAYRRVSSLQSKVNCFTSASTTG